MPVPRITVLVVGATGSIGRLVVEEAIRQGHGVRALARDPGKARQLPPETRMVIGDVIRPETLFDAVDAVDAVVFTLGSDGGGKIGAESVDYGGVRNVLRALGSRTARIALMTSIGSPTASAPIIARRRLAIGSGAPNALKAAVTALESDDTPAAQRLREEYAEALAVASRGQDPHHILDNALRWRVLSAARHSLDDLRRTGAIGDDAFRRVEEELDWLELSAPWPLCRLIRNTPVAALIKRCKTGRLRSPKLAYS